MRKHFPKSDACKAGECPTHTIRTHSLRRVCPTSRGHRKRKISALGPNLQWLLGAALVPEVKLCEPSPRVGEQVEVRREGDPSSRALVSCGEEGGVSRTDEQR